MKAITRTLKIARVTAKVVSKKDEVVSDVVFELPKSNEKQYKSSIESDGYVLINIKNVEQQEVIYAITYEDFMAHAYKCDRVGRPLKEEE